MGVTALLRVCGALPVVLAGFAAGCAGFASSSLGPITGKKYPPRSVAMGEYDEAGAAYAREVRLATYLKTHPETAPELKQAMLAGHVKVGMTREQVQVSWGLPDYTVDRVITGQGTSEVWIYARGTLSFEEGTLSALPE